jgi:hypothetical protein
MELRPRKWVPDIAKIADQLVEDYRKAGDDEGQASLDVFASLQSWQETAKFHGDEITEDDLATLIQVLVRRLVLTERGLRPEEW